MVDHTQKRPQVSFIFFLFLRAIAFLLGFTLSIAAQSQIVSPIP